MNISSAIVHFISVLGSSIALSSSAMVPIAPKFSRNTAKARPNAKCMGGDNPIRKFEEDDVLGVRGIGIGGVGIDAGDVGVGIDHNVGGADIVGSIAICNSIHGVGISGPIGISSVLRSEGGDRSRDKSSVRAHEFAFIFSLS